MKTCKRCGVLKSTSDFHVTRANKDGLANHCKPCRSYALLRKPRYVADRRRLWDFLAENPCVDCGESDPIVLQLDHVRGVKVKAISLMILQGYSWDKVVVPELAKCDVRCANCHSRKTAKEMGWYDFSDGTTRRSSEL